MTKHIMNLKIFAAATILFCVNASAQDFFSWGFGMPEPQPKEKRVKFIYDAHFDYKFDNREFDSGKEQFTESMTLYGARLTPSVGLQVRQNANVRHKLMAGIDVMKDFGRHPSAVASSPECDRGLENTRLFREITMYYGIDAKLGAWNVKGYAGIFPRHLAEGDYSQAFFSDSLKFYDNNLEGALIKAYGPKTYLELAFDWDGQYGSYRREQFNAFGYGKYIFNDFVSAGLAFIYHHYANAAEYGSVVDDAMVQPFVRFGFEKFCGWQDISATLAWYQSLQQDRRQKDGQSNPGGGEFTVSLRNWNVGIENRLYYGKDLMPFYNYVDDGGFKYGNNLYAGSPFYRVIPVNDSGWHFYDRLEVYWQPHIADFMDLRLSIVSHFPDGFKYAGMQQKLSLIFSLDKLLNPSYPAGRAVRRNISRRDSRRGTSEYNGPLFGI